MSASVTRHHADWLSLIEASGPFLTLPVLKRALPQGLEPVDPERVAELRRAHEEWEEDDGLQGEWVRWVIGALLGFDDETLKEGPAVPATLEQAVLEQGETLRPDFVVVDPSQNGKVVPRLLVNVWPPETDLDDKLGDRQWAATPLDRMAELLRAKGVRLGLVTNGERWTLVHVTSGGPTTFATWEAGIWLEDRPTLDAFGTLLSARRFFAVAESDTLESLFDESANAEQEVTDQLGKQVRRAVELLVDAFGRADRDHGGALLEGVPEREIYSAAVTVMMRLVFLLCAEERGLFLLGDSLYDDTYAVSTLRGQLQEEADRFTEEPLERRSAAWYRLLATFRMVYAGVEHENLRLPAYGGTLFDPDRFPFLEGRRRVEEWQDVPGQPLPLDDRTVLHILDALQVLSFRGRGGVSEARRLSFRALDVEQIGHVYEGLLDHTVVEATAPAVGLEGKLEPEIPLAELEERTQGERESFVEWLVKETGRTKRAIEKALDTEIEPHERALLLAACDMDTELADRISPYHGLLREDLRGLPQVFLIGGVYVTKTSERRSSGTYYTPRSLAEEMVRYALEPLVYYPGPAEGAKPDDWKLRPPAALLELKLCDMAMGSGAFLVASCRYLADRLIEAWGRYDDEPITIEGEPAAGQLDELVVPDDPEDRAVLARRLVADRCLYGVDKNLMAVEMAKLSMWLITLAKDRPFSFVDHALRCGDSLLGITDLAQIENFHIDPARGRALFHGQFFDYRSIFAPAVEQAVAKRRALEAFPVFTLRDAQEKERLFQEAEQELETLKVVGDVIIGAALSTASQGEEALERRLLAVADDVAAALDPERKESDRKVRLDSLYWDAVEWLNAGRPIMQPDRRTFHWPLEFPEVFVRGGFDAIAGNPPFQGGKKISGSLGSEYREHLVEHLANGRKGNADLVSYFFLRAATLVQSGMIGLLATNTISQGDTRDVGLDQICASGLSIARAWKSRPWPGAASVEVAQVWLHKGDWSGDRILNGARVNAITSLLDPASRVVGPAHRLTQNHGQAFIGSYVNGVGFLLGPQEARELLTRSPNNADVLFPYLTGDDLNSSPTQSPSRWVINFFDWPLEKAQNYPDSLAIVIERVKPHRDSLSEAKRREREAWWRFERRAVDLYQTVKGMDRLIALAVVSSTLAPAFIRNDSVYAHKVVVFASEEYSTLGLMASSIHTSWVVRHTSTLGSGINYSPSDCFETFPQAELTDEVGMIAKALDEHRCALMLERNEGLTKTYNRVYNPDELAPDIEELRRLHVELDHAVAAAYGWEDLDLDHGFHETPQGIRYTIGPLAQVEVLDRLLELNHDRYAAEVAAGLHDKKKGGKRKRNQVVVGDQTTLDGLS